MIFGSADKSVGDADPQYIRGGHHECSHVVEEGRRQEESAVLRVVLCLNLTPVWEAYVQRVLGDWAAKLGGVIREHVYPVGAREIAVVERGIKFERGVLWVFLELPNVIAKYLPLLAGAFRFC